MSDEYINNPQDPLKERFVCMEAQVTDTNHNVSLLMVALINKLGY